MLFIPNRTTILHVHVDVLCFKITLQQEAENYEYAVIYFFYGTGYWHKGFVPLKGY